jgi:hypothetical protein
VRHWDSAKRPFLTQIAGFALMIIGGLLAPAKPASGAAPSKTSMIPFHVAAGIEAVKPHKTSYLGFTL